MAPSIQSIDDHDQKPIKADATGERPMETVGVYLKRERESKKLSLREVARLTKISELYLDCIEKDDYEKIPKGPYVKGYISSYARMIGGDTEQALQLYDSANNKTCPADEPQIAMPPATGWKASVATAFSTMVESLQELKKRGQRISVQPRDSGTAAASAASLSTKRQTSLEAAGSQTAADPPAPEPADKEESSVLIPFKKFAPGVDGEDATSGEPSPPTETATVSYAAKGLSMLRKGVGFLGAAGPWLRARLSKVEISRLPMPPRTVWLALVGLLVGGTVLVFCGFGVYHVFFFDPPSPTVQGSALPSAGESTLAPPAPQLAPPHKTARFTKPDSPLPAATITPEPLPSAPAKRLPPPAEKADPPPPVAQQRPRAPEDNPAPAAAPPTQPTAPSDININVLKATICSAIKDRMPADMTTVFPLSTDRVYVWSLLQADQYPTAIQHVYYHEETLVNRVELSIRSPFWRTWSFKSIDKRQYRGHWRVDITTMDGEVLRRLYFKID